MKRGNGNWGSGRVAVVVAVVVVCGMAAQAEVTEWQHDPATPGEWLDPSNWSNGSPSSRYAVIANGGTALVGEGGASTREFRLGAEAGDGRVIQTAGKFDTGLIYLGTWPGSRGEYELSGSGIVIAKLYVGSQSFGLFRQSGGEVRTGSVDVGGDFETDEARAAVYELEGGVVTLMTSLHVGGRSDAVFDQSGGTVSVPFMDVQDNGRYLISGGYLSVAEATIDAEGSGSAQVVQTGGVVSVDPLRLTGWGNLEVGTVADSPGMAIYELQNGELGVNRINIGTSGAGSSFRQAGGTASVTGSFMLGVADGASGALDISDGTMTVGGDLVVGAGTSGVGTYQMSGGSVAVQGDISLGRGEGASGALEISGGRVDVGSTVFVAEGPGASGTVDISGGELTAMMMPIGWRGAGRVAQSGGTVTAQQALVVGFSAEGSGEYDFWGGSIDTSMMVVGFLGPGRFNIGDAATQTSVHDMFFRIGAQGVLEAVPGATVHMIGSQFVNESTNPGALGGLAQLALVMEGDEAGSETFEVAGLDMGAMLGGYVDDFALGTLQLGGEAGVGDVQLVDQMLNAVAATSGEALYVKHLVLEAGSTLNLNGLNLYYQRLTDLGGSVVGSGGSLVEVAVLEGDLNGDGAVNALDIAPFVTSIVDGRAYALNHPHLDMVSVADLNRDGRVNALDIAGFVASLTGGGSVGTVVPEPGVGALLLAGVAFVTQRRGRA